MLSESYNDTQRENSEAKTIGAILDNLDECAENREKVKVEDIVEQLGRRSFAPFLLLAGIITLSPGLGDIPGVPTLIALFVLLVAAQRLMNREGIWLPGWMLNRKIKSKHLKKAAEWMRKPGHWIDKRISPRLTYLTGKVGDIVITVACIAIALALPPMEFIPFSANAAGAALTAFGLATLADDGLLALIALVITLATFVFIISVLV